MIKQLAILSLISFLAITAFATPPMPPLGYRWVINQQFSDEFNGDKLDSKKWNDTFGDWEGRAPALFVPEAITVQNGNLEIKSGILEKPYKNYTMFGGAVSSSSYDAHFGYYECHAKASKIAMSTTFWLSNFKTPFEHSDCETDSYSQELDIQECIGGGTVHAKFRNGMNSNTHFRYIRCGKNKEEFISKGTGTTLHSEVSDEYHTYGCWWVDANKAMFYANNKLFDTVEFRTDISERPFDRPMKVNMVTETYNWQPPPPNKDLLNDSINTAFYDWVRCYILVPINKSVEDNYPEKIYEENIEILNFKRSKDESNISFDYCFKANANGTIELSIKQGKKKVQKASIAVLKGYGIDNFILPFSFKPKKGTEYILEASFKSLTDEQVLKLKWQE